MARVEDKVDVVVGAGRTAGTRAIPCATVIPQRRRETNMSDIVEWVLELDVAEGRIPCAH